MFVAKDKSKKNVAAELASKENVYFCPSCGSELILKTGSINTPHFAHKNKDDCDTFTHDMSRWHKEWQDAFPVANREVPLELEIDEEEYFVAKTHWGFDDDSPKNNYGYYHDKILLYESKKDSVGLELLNMKHRADVLACGYVIEFQHSPISKSEFNERNWFYLGICRETHRHQIRNQKTDSIGSFLV